MRTTLAAAALAALTLAAPAAAQPDAGALMRQAMEQLAANEGEHVQDYTLTLVHPVGRTPVYIVRDGGEWSVHLPESGLSEFLGMALFWPEFSPTAANPDEMDELDASVYEREDVVEGRRAHVIQFPIDGPEMGQMDSLRYYVDVETHHLLRVSASMPLPADDPGEMESFTEGALMEITLDGADHRETDGLVIPRKVRVRMRVEGPLLDAAARQSMRAEFDAGLKEFEGSTEPEMVEMLAMMQVFAQLISEEGMDLRMTVEDVRVNPGPPAWLDEMEN